MDHELDRTLSPPETTCGTGRLADFQTGMTLFLVSLGVLFSLALPAFAQSMPENAKSKTYGDGWECIVGYRIIEESCVAIEVPQNAYATRRTFGHGWKCYHGFREIDGTACLAVEVPDGGYLDSSGERWNCLRGYAKLEDSCREIVLPENAFLVDNSDGSKWACGRGFEIKGDNCTAIAVPDNAFLNSSGYGRPWTCERGFFAQDGLCQAVAVPANAFLDDATYGKGWTCERGYVALDDACSLINVPEYGHLDRSGRRWECNRNFQKSKGQCVFRN